MKVRIDELHPNPFRDLKNYPINREKVEALKASIKQTGFWDNILAREINGQIQIAYGHHRLIALQEGLKNDYVVDIPVKELPDSVMIQVMANENSTDWRDSPSVTNETVRVARDFLEQNPKEIKTENPIHRRKAGPNDRANVFHWSPLAFQIHEFLGWPEQKVFESLRALTMIADNDIDPVAIRDLPTERHQTEFVRARKKDPEFFTPRKQREFAKEIKESFEDDSKKDHIPSKEIHKKVLQEKWTPKKKDNQKEIERKEKNLVFDQFIRDTLFVSRDLINRVKDMKKIKDELGDSLIVDKKDAILLTANFETLHRLLTNLLNIKENE